MAETTPAEQTASPASKAQHDGSLYLPDDPEIMAEQLVWMDKLDQYNLTRVDEQDRRTELLQEMFASFGEGSWIEPPLNANFGGKFTHIGAHVYLNSNVTLVDDTEIRIGDHTMIGPNCVLSTAGHPVNPRLRAKAYQFNLPIEIGSNCWLGAGVIVLPGVSIGDNTVVGAGSVVTKSLPANVVAVGNPARVLREIGAHDEEFYTGARRIPDEQRHPDSLEG